MLELIGDPQYPTPPDAVIFNNGCSELAADDLIPLITGNKDQRWVENLFLIPHF